MKKLKLYPWRLHIYVESLFHNMQKCIVYKRTLCASSLKKISAFHCALWSTPENLLADSYCLFSCWLLLLFIIVPLGANQSKACFLNSLILCQNCLISNNSPFLALLNLNLPPIWHKNRHLYCCWPNVTKFQHEN